MKHDDRVGILLLILATLVGSAAGCGDDQDPNCTLPSEGNFIFNTERLAVSPPDSLSDIEVTIPGAVLDTVLDFSGSVSPTIIYRFRAPGRPSFDVIFDWIGATLPIETGDTVTLNLEKTQGTEPKQMAFSMSDDQGLRYLAVNDWRPGWGVLEPGYPHLGTSGQLQVFLVEAGCTPRVENTECYRSITNYRIDFAVGNEPPLALYNGQTGQIGTWIFHVFKGELVRAQSGCFEGLLNQNNMSFSVERSGLR